jgi:outer membrane protein
MYVIPDVFVAGSNRRAIIVAAVLVCAFVAFAPQTTAATRTITFEEAVDIALERNLGLLLAGNRRGLDDASVSDALWRFLPDLRMSVSGNRSFDKTQTGTGGTSWTSGNSLSAGLSSGVTLFDGFANTSSLREARFEQAAGNLDYGRARQTVVFQVITDYLALIEATEQERVRLENLAAQQEQIERVWALVEEGERPINELYQQEANVAEAKLALVEARRTLELSRVDLVQTLHLDPLEEIYFAIPSADELDPGEVTGTYAALVRNAFLARSDLAAETERLSASEERVTQAKANRWPTLSLSGNFTSRYSDATDDDFFGQLDDRQSAGVGLSFSFPIFDRMQTRNATHRAEINLENAEIALDQLRQEVALQVRRAVLDRDAARESLSAAKTRVAAARESLLYTNERYLAGATTLFEVTLARASLVAAESGEVGARYRLLWQNHLVDYYVGTLEPEAGIGR